MIEFDLTAHAKTVAIARNIKSEWIASTLSSPELQLPDHEDIQLMHALSRIPDYDNRVLRVVTMPTQTQFG